MKRYQDLIITACVMSMLSACSQPAKETSTKPDESKKTVASAAETTTTTTTDTKETSEAEKKSDAGETESKTDTVAQADKAGQAVKTANGQVKINLNDLANDVPICLVAGNSIKVGDYKRMLKLQQLQLNQTLTTDPQVRARLLAEAKSHNITLTADEKRKILESAKHQQGPTEKEFKDFLAAHHVTEKQFDDEILSTGLAFKASNALIEQGLLPEMVNRELLAQAAIEAGRNKEAEKKYTEFKNSKVYPQLEKQTALPKEELHAEIVKAELAKLQIAKLEKQAVVSNDDLKKLYDENKSQFQHGERIHLSTIIIAAPTKDMGPVRSVKTQIAAINSKLSPKDLDNAVSQFMEAAKQKALILLGRAKGGEDFAKLANESSDDGQTRSNKTGGEIGWVEQKQLSPDLGKPLFQLKAGEVLPQVVQSDMGFMLYKVTGKEGPGYVSFNDLKPLLQAKAKQDKTQVLVNSWLNQRKKVVKIEFTPKFLNLATGTSPATSQAPATDKAAPAKAGG